MKVIIAGGRSYTLTDDGREKLDQIDISEVVSSGDPGADRCGCLYAQMHGIPVARFYADWQKFGRAAGPIRNRQMAEYADAVALFNGGSGTKSMFLEANKAGIKIFDFRDSSKDGV